jgi:predicted nucleotidyltransferase
MKTIIKPAVWKILNLFYNNRNSALHLREIARETKMNESSISRHLNNLVAHGILKVSKEANLKKFTVTKEQVKNIFPLFDEEKLENLPLLRKDAIKIYLNKIEKRPLLVIIFGSTAKGTFRKDSDIDILQVSSTKNEVKETTNYVEAQTGIKLHVLIVTEEQFKKELKMKEDYVVQAALSTGFPVFNAPYYYETVGNE